MSVEDRRDIVLRLRTGSDNACDAHAALLLEAADFIDALRIQVHDWQRIFMAVTKEANEPT